VEITTRGNVKGCNVLNFFISDSETKV